MELELGRPKAREEPRGLARPRPQRHRRARRRIGRGRTPGWRIAARAAPPRARGRTNLHPEPRPRRRPGTRRRRTRVPSRGCRRRRGGGERGPARVRPGVRTRRGPRGMNLDDINDTAGATAYVDDDDLDSPEQHQTHDVIITEIEEINLTDYMQTLQAPTFSEEALATADFGFGGDRTFSGGLYGAGMNGFDAAASPKQGAGGVMGGSDKFPMRSETPGRAGRRVWSRGGNRSTDAGSGGLATATPGIDRPQTGGLDEADVNRPLHTHGLDDDEDGGDPEVDADIFDDSDDDSWGEETHAVDTFGGNQNATDVLSDDEDGGHAASPKAMGAVNPSFGGSAIAARSPGGAGGGAGVRFRVSSAAAARRCRGGNRRFRDLLLLLHSRRRGRRGDVARRRGTSSSCPRRPVCDACRPRGAGPEPAGAGAGARGPAAAAAGDGRLEPVSRTARAAARRRLSRTCTGRRRTPRSRRGGRARAGWGCCSGRRAGSGRRRRRPISSRGGLRLRLRLRRRRLCPG